MVYPFLRAVIFIFCSLFLLMFITPFLGFGKSYNSMLVRDGVAHFIWFRFLFLVVMTLISFGLLYLAGRICKRPTTKKTYLLMLMILFILACYATWAFLDGNLWSYPPETTVINI